MGREVRMVPPKMRIDSQQIVQVNTETFSRDFFDTGLSFRDAATQMGCCTYADLCLVVTGEKTEVTFEFLDRFTAIILRHLVSRTTTKRYIATSELQGKQAALASARTRTGQSEVEEG